MRRLLLLYLSDYCYLPDAARERPWAALIRNVTYGEVSLITGIDFRENTPKHLFTSSGG